MYLRGTAVVVLYRTYIVFEFDERAPRDKNRENIKNLGTATDTTCDMRDIAQNKPRCTKKPSETDTSPAKQMPALCLNNNSSTLHLVQHELTTT